MTNKKQRVPMCDAVADALLAHAAWEASQLRVVPDYYEVSLELLDNMSMRGIDEVAGRPRYTPKCALPWVPGRGPQYHLKASFLP